MSKDLSIKKYKPGDLVVAKYYQEEGLPIDYHGVSNMYKIVDTVNSEHGRWYRVQLRNGLIRDKGFIFLDEKYRLLTKAEKVLYGY